MVVVVAAAAVAAVVAVAAADETGVREMDAAGIAAPEVAWR